MSGSVGIGFGRPGLEGDVVWTPNRAIAGYDRLSLSLKPLPASSPEQVAGRVNLAVYAGKERRFTASGRVGVKPDRITFRELAVQTEGMAGSVTVDAEMIVSRPQIFAEVRLRAEGLQMAGDVKGSSLSGAASVQGTLERYEGQFDLRHSASRPLWLTGRLQGKICWKRAGAQSPGGFRRIARRGPDGRPGMDVGGESSAVVSGTGRKARSRPDFPGLAGACECPRSRRLDLGGRGGAPAGQLRPGLWTAFCGAVPLTVQLRPVGKRAVSDLSAARSVAKDSNCLSRESQPSASTTRSAPQIYRGSYPGRRAASTEQAGSAGRTGGGAGTLSARGASLLYAGCSIGAVEADARLSDSGTDRITAKVNASHLAYRSWRADRGQLSVEGKTAQHDARLQLTGPAGEILLSLKGGYGKSVWQGRIVEGVMQDRQAGALRLERSAALLIAADRLRIGALSFAGPGEEALFVDGDLRLRPLRGDPEGGLAEAQPGAGKGVFRLREPHGPDDGSP